MTDSVNEVLTNLINFIMGIIDYIKGLVAYFRDENDGGEGEMPEFPSLTSEGE